MGEPGLPKITEIEAALNRKELAGEPSTTNQIQVDREDFISMQIEVRLISTMLQEILEGHENRQHQQDAVAIESVAGNLSETQTLPALSRVGSRNTSFKRNRQNGELIRTASFPMASPRRQFKNSKQPTIDNAGYRSYANLTKQPAKATRTKSWKIPRSIERPGPSQIRRYQTFYKIPSSVTVINKQPRTMRTYQNTNNNRVQRGQTFVEPSRGNTTSNRNIAKVKRGQSFPARYHQQDFMQQNQRGNYSNGTVPRSFSGEIKKRSTLQDLNNYHARNQGLIGNISIDYGDVNPIFDVEDSDTIVITEC